jgi:hypothetical protein
VAALAGISEDEMARFKQPAEFASQGGGVAQPPIDPTQPHMRGLSWEAYQASVTTPDRVIWEQASETTPPVRVDD